MYNLILFGAGVGCKDLLIKLDNSKINILAFVDNNTLLQHTFINNIIVICPKEIHKFQYDYIVITNLYFDEIFEQLIDLGVKKDKIIGFKFYKSNLLTYSERHINILNNLCLYKTENYSACSMLLLGRTRSIDVSINGDYVRFSSLELAAKEIYDKTINGSIAELGVYKGDFAAALNDVFYDRKLFLFDTFEGFNENDIEADEKSNLSISSTTDFSDTSIDIVLRKMKYPENCIIKKGYFPHTTENVDEQFAFVSIDADLFNPTYSGLKFFYPRMTEGGYIFIHDYNNLRYKGVKEAVKKYCQENSIYYFPLSDTAGTAVIIKSGLLH